LCSLGTRLQTQQLVVLVLVLEAVRALPQLNLESTDLLAKHPCISGLMGTVNIMTVMTTSTFDGRAPIRIVRCFTF
jgi:hypothetical protein